MSVGGVHSTVYKIRSQTTHKSTLSFVLLNKMEPIDLTVSDSDCESKVSCKTPTTKRARVINFYPTHKKWQEAYEDARKSRRIVCNSDLEDNNESNVDSDSEHDEQQTVEGDDDDDESDNEQSTVERDDEDEFDKPVVPRKRQLNVDECEDEPEEGLNDEESANEHEFKHPIIRKKEKKLRGEQSSDEDEEEDEDECPIIRRKTRPEESLREIMVNM
jgi:hypothetical protein